MRRDRYSGDLSLPPMIDAFRQHLTTTLNVFDATYLHGLSTVAMALASVFLLRRLRAVLPDWGPMADAVVHGAYGLAAIVVISLISLLGPVALASPSADWMVAVLIMLAAHLAAVLLLTFLQAMVDSARLPNVFRFAIYLISLVAAMAVVLSSVLGIDLSALLLGSGILVGILGLAFQGLLRDIIAGLSLYIDDAFRAGEWISFNDSGLGEMTARVVNISWRAVHLVDILDRHILVANDSLLNQTVKNHTRSGPYWFYFTVSMDHELDLAEARRLVLDAALSTGHFTGAGEVFVHLVDIGEFPPKLGVFAKADDYPSFFGVRNDLMLAMAARAQASGFAVPAATRGHSERYTPTINAADRDVLQANVFFRSLADETFETLWSATRSMEISEGSVLIEQGSTGTSMYVVTSGMLLVRRQDHGRALDLGTVSIGEFVGEQSLFTGEPRGATVTAATPVRVLEIPKEIITDIAAQNEAFLGEISRVLADRADNLKKKREGAQRPERARRLTSEIQRRVRRWLFEHGPPSGGGAVASEGVTHEASAKAASPPSAERHERSPFDGG